MVMEIPKGYKQTEVGIIPEDWDVCNIGDLNAFVTSGSRGWATFYSEYGSPFIRITNLQRKSIYLDTNDLKCVDLPIHSTEGSRTALKNGDVLISITADIGIIGYIDDRIDKPSYINQHIALVRFTEKDVDSKFISYFLSSENVQGIFRGTTDQGAKAGLNLDAIKSIKFVKPNKKEQTAIATILSDVDTFITSLTTLIQKKRQIKTATMQRLLTGKQRLPGFGEGKGMQKTELGEIPEDWEVCTIKDFAPLQRGFDLPNTKLRNGEYPVIYSNGAMNFHNEYMIEGEGVITGRSGTIGKVHYVKGKYWPHNTTLWVTRFKNSIPLYVYYLYGYIGFDRFLSGSGVPTLNRNDVHTFLIAVPKPEEQEAIANVLSDIDADLDTLETRLAKAKAIKQGMMQELLTGKTRLIQPQSQPDQGE